MSSPLPWTMWPVRRLLLFLLAFVPIPTPALGDAPLHYIVDSAGIVDDDAERVLSGRLQELENKTGAQMIVLTVDSTEGVPIEEYALEKAERWKLGQRDRDDGLLFVVAVRDRRYRIEVGYGLEGVLPDSLAGSIARQHLVPLFRQGKYSEGITAVVVAVTDTIARSQGVTLDQAPVSMSPSRTKSRGSPLEEGLFIVFFLLVLGMGLSRRYPPGGVRRYPGRSVAGGFPMAGRGSFGGGFGSFGGGRGGGFGGGGVSGGW